MVIRTICASISSSIEWPQYHLLLPMMTALAPLLVLLSKGPFPQKLVLNAPEKVSFFSQSKLRRGCGDWIGGGFPQHRYP